MVEPQTMFAKIGSHCLTLKSLGEGRLGNVCPTLGRSRWPVHLLLGFSVILALASRATAVVPANDGPILVSESTSTRAVAVESLELTREPFALISPYGAPGQRTRVMVFAMNLTLQPSEDLSVVSADAEDAQHRHYTLSIESISPVPSYEWLSALVFKLNDDMGDVGDVLISVAYHSVVSNRVRIAIGHLGGGPPDDPGAVPTPGLRYTISGQLTANGGQGLSGVTINLSGPQSGTIVTGATGLYSFTVSRVGEYTLTPVNNPYYTFAARTLFSVNGSQTVNIPGTLRYYTVSGWAQLLHTPAAGLVIPIRGSLTTTVTTDESGRYSISLPAGGNYEITPSVTFYTFYPTSQFVNDLTSDQGGRFFFGNRELFTIKGKLKDQENNGLSGFTVNLSGADQRTAVTDGNGNYEFPNLFAGYNYTVTPPSTASYTFAAQNVNALLGNQTLDFVGLRRVALSGKVKDQSGNGLIGITVTLSGTESGSTTTAADGSYSLTATATGNYAVTPSIAQDYYTFGPASEQFDNLAGPHITDFTAAPVAIPNPSQVLEFDGTPKTVDYGPFWPESVNLGHFFWEFWAMPGANAAATYMLSDGYGGAHALLFGVGSFNSSEVNRYELLGNIFDGVKFDNYFGSDVGPAVGEWAHFAVGWDGQNIITYYNGVPVGKTPFAGPRRTPGPGGGGGRLLIGGSDHSNFDGRIAQVRGYEDMNPRESSPGSVEASFAPQTVFGLGGNLLSYYFRYSPRLIADLSGGYRGNSHPGFLRGTSTGIIYYCESCPPPQFVIDPSAPNFATGAPSSPVNVPPAAAPPGGALVFDSFARANSTYTFGSRGGLGSTESGAAGTKVWQTSQPAANPQPFGILNARAVLLANATAVAWVPTGSASGDVDVRVNRYTGRWGSGIHTGLSFRVVDANNFFFAYTADTSGSPNSKTVRVGYYLNGQRVDLTAGVAMPSSWTTLRIVTRNSGGLEIYVDSTLVYSTNSPLLASATSAGLYNDSAGMGLVNRWDNFTVFNAP